MSESKELPKGWARARIDELVHIVNGMAFKPSQWSTEGLPIIRIQNLNDPHSSFNYCTQELPDKFKVRTGDLLFAWSGTPGTSFGAHVWRGGNAWLNQHIFILHFDRKYLHPTFLRYAINQNLDSYIRQAHGGAGLAHITKGRFEESVLPLAPLPEQHRIVEKIEELFSDLDAGVSALQRAKANLKRYRASVLKSAVEGRLTEEWRKEHPQAEDAVGHIERTPPPPLPNRWSTRSKDTIYGHGALSVGNTGTRLPASWTWTPLVRIARMETGHTPSRKHPEWWGGEIPWIGITDARNHHGGIINATGENTNDDGLANSASRLLPKGTVCVSRTASVGYVVVMGCDMATSQDFVNWVPTDCVSSDWLRVVFMTDRNVLVRFGKGTVHKTIYFPEWLSTHIALPPLAEQEQIVLLVEERLSQIDSAVKTIDAELIRAKRLRQSILKQAFEGKLVPQDPKDEPASVLLERIKASQAEQPKKKAKKARARAK